MLVIKCIVLSIALISCVVVSSIIHNISASNEEEKTDVITPGPENVITSDQKDTESTSQALDTTENQSDGSSETQTGITPESQANSETTPLTDKTPGKSCLKNSGKNISAKERSKTVTIDEGKNEFFIVPKREQMSAENIPDEDSDSSENEN